ncbi:MAG: cell division protein [Bacteroidetes bacterium]|jgi:ligand-binding SRPBCC domain-containing protein|nr:cell division protein [Bacteroidota bacterium]
MPQIILHTKINAPIERCFLLSLSIELHKAGTTGTNEEAIDGITTGIMKLNDTVTWRATHFGIRQTLTSKITTYEKPNIFIDEMLKGVFKKIHHTHSFKEENSETVLTDIFTYEAPLGILGRIAENLFLTGYLTDFISRRNEVLKKVAEGEDWKRFL